MKKSNILLATLAGMAFVLGSCTDEFENQHVVKYTGEEIVFGARAGFEINGKASTRTIYTGQANNWTDAGGKTYEGVNWIYGDQVRIFCAEASGTKVADYTVTLSEADTLVSEEAGIHGVGLAKNGDVALQWGNTAEPHTFYAIYPSPSQYLGTGTTSSEVFNSTTADVKGVIPNVQVHKGKYYYSKGTYTAKDQNNADVTGVHHIVAPDMNYAYMVAKTVVNEPNLTSAETYLKFMPIATAVEITISNLAKNDQFKEGYTFQLANVFVSSADNSTPIYGGFNLNLDEGMVDARKSNGVLYSTGETKDGFADSIPATAITLDPTVASGTQISLPMYQDGIYGHPISLNYGDAITFTVFLLPTVDVNSLKVTIQGVGGTRTGLIEGIHIKKQKKTYLKNVPMTGAILPFTQAEWIKYVENDILIGDLSIPGAGGAASGFKTSGTYNVASSANRQQNLDIRGLWNHGIRCFEFATDVTASSGYLKDEPVVCNGEDCKVDLEQAVDSVIAALKDNPQEFAMVILTYQTMGGWGARTPSEYMTRVNVFWNEVRTKLTNQGLTNVLYNPSTKTGNVRGNLFCIVRPTSKYQDYNDDTNGKIVSTLDNNWLTADAVTLTTKTSADLELESPTDGMLVVHGWGALKDKWQQRGYSKVSLRHTAKSTSVSTTTDTLPGRPFDVSTMRTSRYGACNSGHSAVTWRGATWYGALPYNSSYNPGVLTPNFSYETSLGTDNGAWIQEWARVSNTDNGDIWAIVSDSARCYHLLHNHGKMPAVYWDNTKDEKIQHIQDALLAAISKDKPGCSIYINSLCGYYVDPTISQSYIPCLLTDYNANNNTVLSTGSAAAGLAGNIEDFAEDMNQMFYDYLQDVTSGYVPGSMGITLMDRVGGESETNYKEPGDMIPSIIVANNFQIVEDAQAATSSEIPLVSNDGETPAYDPETDTRALKASGEKADGEMTITWK